MPLIEQMSLLNLDFLNSLLATAQTEMVIALKEFFLHELLYLPEYMLKPTKQAFL
jgi:hypothetical protein